jgi:hypothetical protein
MKSVRIVGGADASSVKVIDADTGLPIVGIKELRLTIKAGDPAVCEAVLQFRVMSLNQAAEMVKFDVEPVPGVVINAPLVVGSRLVDVPPAVPNAGGVAAVHLTEYRQSPDAVARADRWPLVPEFDVDHLAADAAEVGFGAMPEAAAAEPLGIPVFTGCKRAPWPVPPGLGPKVKP